MASLSDYLVPVDSPEGGSVAFRVERAVPGALLEEEDFLGLPEATARLVGEVLAHADYAADLAYDVELVRAALRRRREDEARLPHERFRDACRRLMRRASIAICARTD